ncbi:MAG TPA: dTMP kinase [Chloroflexota bacterium]|nr:dTMP kinase [Chloroflexota bacterium]
MGAFVVLEGPEGGGKTSHARALANKIAEAGCRTVLTREPGGTELGDVIRDIVLPANSLSISSRAEALLYCASRAQLVDEVVRPALEEGYVVVSDRYSYSTIAYQGYGRGLDVRMLTSVTRFASAGLEPDLCILLDLPPRLGLERKRGMFLAGDTEEWNRFEQEEVAFHQRVRNGYLQLARSDPARWLVLDATLPFETLQDRIMEEVFFLLYRRRVLRRPT